jgi:hypothetical protein
MRFSELAGRILNSYRFLDIDLSNALVGSAYRRIGAL